MSKGVEAGAGGAHLGAVRRPRWLAQGACEEEWKRLTTSSARAKHFKFMF